MGFTDLVTNMARLWAPLDLKAAMSLEAPPTWALREAEREHWTMPDGSLYTNQAELYKRLAWVQIAVGSVAQTMATTPFAVKQLQGEDEQAIDNHPFELLLRRPNPLQSRFELLYATLAWRKLTGNVYWWLNRASATDQPSELWIIPSNKIKPIPDGNLFLRGYLYDPGNGIGKLTLEPWEIMHSYTYNPASMFIGLSPIEAISVVATGDRKMQEWNTNFFAKDNAKVPGFLAYKDMINDSDWERLKAESAREYGGTNRKLMQIRGVGQGGVEWVQTAMSQTDMEFISGRTHNKEEIWSLYAPGLASMLAVNATEANSVSGRATFLEMAVWPELVSIAEKITNDLLPVYGNDLIGEFDDIRHTDRTLELEEQKAYERTHTIDEVRKKYGGDVPIGDERGKLLVAEVPTARVTARDPNAAVSEQAGVAVPPTGNQPAVSPGEAAVAESNKAADLDKWERKALKRVRDGKAAAVRFESEYITDEECAAIETALAEAGSEEAVKAAFASNPSTSRSNRTVLLGTASQLGDDGDRHPNLDVELMAGAKAAALTPAETALMSRIRAILTSHGKDAAAALVNGTLPPLDGLSTDLRAAIQSAVVQAVVERATVLAGEIGPDFDPAIMANTASEWAETYTFDLVGGITDHTRTLLQKTLSTYQKAPMTRDQLVQALAPAFGEQRAGIIASTEITRASAQGASQYQEYLTGVGIEMERVNRTNADDRVCSVCGPLDGKSEADWPDDAGPPWHVGCRCAVTLQVK